MTQSDYFAFVVAPFDTLIALYSLFLVAIPQSYPTYDHLTFEVQHLVR